MKNKTVNTGTIPGSPDKFLQQRWWRIALLAILGYEAAGCLLGGPLLMLAPSGRYMDMPVDLMHGAFPDFFIPGAILLGLGILNLSAFIAVKRRSEADWLLAAIANGGLTIWFITEIAILQQLHWLHLMWGYPVLLAWVMMVPLIVSRNDETVVLKILLACGIIACAWYAAINIILPVKYPGYSMMRHTVSELSAIGAPTRIKWFLLSLPYPLLTLLFGWGLLLASLKDGSLRMSGTLMIAYSVLNFYWPPMHGRQVIAAGNTTLTDTLHLLWTIVNFSLAIIMMIAVALHAPRWLWRYTAAMFFIFIVSGFLTFLDSAGLTKNFETPYIGLWERINIGVFLGWIIALALYALREEEEACTPSGSAGLYEEQLTYTKRSENKRQEEKAVMPGAGAD